MLELLVTLTINKCYITTHTAMNQLYTDLMLCSIIHGFLLSPIQFVFFYSAFHIHNSPDLYFSRDTLRLNRPQKLVSEMYLKCSYIKYNGYLFLHSSKIANIDSI